MQPNAQYNGLDSPATPRAVYLPKHRALHSNFAIRERLSGYRRLTTKPELRARSLHGLQRWLTWKSEAMDPYPHHACAEWRAGMSTCSVWGSHLVACSLCIRKLAGGSVEHSYYRDGPGCTIQRRYCECRLAQYLESSKINITIPRHAEGSGNESGTTVMVLNSLAVSVFCIRHMRSCDAERVVGAQMMIIRPCRVSSADHPICKTQGLCGSLRMLHFTARLTGHCPQGAATLLHNVGDVTCL